MRFTDLFDFIQNRRAIFVKRSNGELKPWTNDPILQNYRFCNVHREDDTVTKWIAENWREPEAENPFLWFALCVARLVNWPETLEELGFPVPWDPGHFVSVLSARAERGDKVFSSAYIVSTNGHATLKPVYLSAEVISPLWEARLALEPSVTDTLASYHKKLSTYRGFGSFMAAQVIADLKYVAPLNTAPDWWLWAASGPGSRRGLNRVMARSPNSTLREKQFEAELARLQIPILKLCDMASIPPLHAQDLQNCLCEFDKYERTRLGEGRPRQTYEGV